MNHERESMRARAYLLGTSGERDLDAIEQEYFRSPDALEMIEAAEEALIEDYLAGRVTTDERAQFERHYLASPHHRTRVETIRRLSTTGSVQTFTPRGRFSGRTLAIAAALVLAVGAGVWIATERNRTNQLGPASPAPPTQTATVPALTWHLSPDTVRGAADTPALVIPAQVDAVLLQFEGISNERPITGGRIVIRTIAGDEVWQGPVTVTPGVPAGVIAVASVPASRLKPEDYTVALLETGATGADVERNRYFLRVRAR